MTGQVAFSGTGSRPLIAGAVLVTTGWIAALVVVRPLGFWPEFGLRFAPMLLAFAALAAAIASMVGFARRADRPAAFRVVEGLGFVAPPSPAAGYQVTTNVLLFGLLGGMAVRQWTAPPGGDIRAVSAVFGVLISVMAVAGGCATALATVAALRGRPCVELTPGGVVLRELLGSRTIPWEALRPGQPAGLMDRWMLGLNVDRRELVTRRGRTSRLFAVSLVQLWVDWRFLAAAVWFYVEHPDRRHALGTRAEHDRLLRDLQR